MLSIRKSEETSPCAVLCTSLVVVICSSLVLGFGAYVLSQNKDAAHQCGNLYEFVILLVACSCFGIVQALNSCCSYMRGKKEEKGFNCFLFLGECAVVGAFIWLFVLYGLHMKKGKECSMYYEEHFYSLWQFYIIMFWTTVGGLSLILLCIILVALYMIFSCIKDCCCADGCCS